MRAFTKRQFNIINTLFHKKNRVSSEHLSKMIGISSKTIRKDIQLMEDDLKQMGARIDSKTGSGYLLEILNPDCFDYHMSFYIENSREKGFSLPQAHQQAHYIVRRLLVSELPIKIQQLADELYTTRAMITQQMKLVRKYLSRFDLTIQVRAKHGMKIVGRELHVRNCLIYEQEFFCDNTLFVQENEYAKIVEMDEYQKAEIETLIFTEKDKFDSFDISFANIQRLVLVIHLIALRFQSHPLESFSELEEAFIENRNSFKLSNYIALQCERRFQIHFSKEELIYLAVVIASYRNVSSYSKVANRAVYFSNYDLATNLVGQLAQINHFKKMDQDNQLIESLALHFIAMMFRVKFKVYLPMGSSYIKRICSGGLELSIQAAQYFHNYLGIDLSEDEILYLTYIFSPIYGRYRPLVAKRRIAIVSDISTNVAYTIAERFMRNFSAYLDSIDVVELYDLKRKDLTKWDVIFTTLDKKYFRDMALTIPVEEINMFFTEKDKIRLRNVMISVEDHFLAVTDIFNERCFFSKLKVNKKEDLIPLISRKLHDVMELDEQFEQDLIRRDELCGAEIGENMARFRTLSSHGPKTFISVFVLEKPIVWQLENIQIIFVWHHGTEEKAHVYEESGYIGNILKTAFTIGEGAVSLLQNPQYSCLKEILRQTVREVKSLQVRS